MSPSTAADETALGSPQGGENITNGSRLLTSMLFSDSVPSICYLSIPYDANENKIFFLTNHEIIFLQ